MKYTYDMSASPQIPSQKILLSDGAGVTGRQTAGLLHRAGPRVGVLTSDPLTRTKFTRSVRWRHRTGGFGHRPIEWLDEALDAFRSGGYDVLVPTQEQVAVLSWAADRERLAGTATAVPPFDALAAVLDKATAEQTLDCLDISRPTTLVLGRGDDPDGWERFPAFVKRPVATASTGVVRVDEPEQLHDVLRAWDDGRLLAFHANLRVREGVRGGAGNKRSIVLPAVREAIERLGSDLRWTGGLSADVILGPDGPVVIDVNPRLVEPVNAARSGVDLVGAMLDVALHGAGRGPRPAPQPDSRPDVATHQLLLNLLGAAQHERTRRAVLRELGGAALRTGPYRGSTEELTPSAHDRRTLIPVAVVAAATLALPSAWERFSSSNIASYAITPEGWAQLTG